MPNGFHASANSAGIFDAGIPSQSTDGGSQIIDTEGRLLAEAGYGESMVACAEIDAGKVRHSRARIGMDNYLARLRTEPFLSTYQRVVYPANTLDGVPPSRAQFHANIGAGIASISAVAAKSSTENEPQ